MRIRGVLFLSLLGFLVAVNPFNNQMAGVTSSESPVQTAQMPGPPPPDCGIYDICKEKAKA